MPRKKKIPHNDLGIPEYEMESLARILRRSCRSILPQKKESVIMLNGKNARMTAYITPRIRKLLNEPNLLT